MKYIVSILIGVISFSANSSEVEITCGSVARYTCSEIISRDDKSYSWEGSNQCKQEDNAKGSSIISVNKDKNYVKINYAVPGDKNLGKDGEFMLDEQFAYKDCMSDSSNSALVCTKQKGMILKETATLSIGVGEDGYTYAELKSDHVFRVNYPRKAMKFETLKEYMYCQKVDFSKIGDDNN